MTSPSRPPGDGALGARQLADHVEECDVCRQAPPPLEQITTSLLRSQTVADPAALSARTLARLRPLLERRATARLWRRVLTGILLALVPLPAVLVYNAYLLLLAYDVERTLLGATFATYLIVSDAALLILLFAATYAAIPIVLVRRQMPALASSE